VGGGGGVQGLKGEGMGRGRGATDGRQIKLSGLLATQLHENKGLGRGRQARAGGRGGGRGGGGRGRAGAGAGERRTDGRTDNK